MHLIQLQHTVHGRVVAVVEGERLYVLSGFTSTYALARAAAAAAGGAGLAEFAQRLRTSETLDYGAIYRGESPWRVLPSFDHPAEPSRCLVSGTGLTHLASARNRDAMHAKDPAAKAEREAAPLTDSMKMFQWGVAGGKPAPGAIGAAPEWFYKGNGHILRPHGAPLDVPAFADDGGEEPEVCGCYIIDDAGAVRRVGWTIGNEFSDHQMERKNYLYLAPSKLRYCSIGPELVVGADLRDVRGTVRVERGGKELWSKAVMTGEENMCHSIANLEHHHFKYPQHRRPGDAHVHFLGADAFSFGAGVALQDGDVMAVEWQGLGRPLRNPIRIERSKPELIRVEAM